jgi:hypothetical protein
MEHVLLIRRNPSIKQLPSYPSKKKSNTHEINNCLRENLEICQFFVSYKQRLCKAVKMLVRLHVAIQVQYQKQPNSIIFSTVFFSSHNLWLNVVSVDLLVLTLLRQFRNVSVSMIKSLSFSNLHDTAVLICFVRMFAKEGTRLRLYAINRKVAGSITVELIGIVSIYLIPPAALWPWGCLSL